MRRPNPTPIPRVAARKTGPTGRRYQARDATKIATTTINTIVPRTKMRRFVVRNWEPARATGGRAPGVRSILIDRAGRTPALTWSGRSRRSELRRRTSQDASERRGTGGVSPKCHPTRELLADHESHDQGCPWGGFLSPLNTSLDR